ERTLIALFVTRSQDYNANAAKTICPRNQTSLSAEFDLRPLFPDHLARDELLDLLFAETEQFREHLATVLPHVRRCPPDACRRAGELQRRVRERDLPEGVMLHRHEHVSHLDLLHLGSLLDVVERAAWHIKRLEDV